ncbi:signal peptidase I [Candidatus Adlerbacteria bacterium RIFCSPHIGHO2_01_FULL_54_23]|uniref:Signal peptidase I n=2 Tax=Candidatus Adleribacteriota TaxID=1752736 RepID=A0A1F4Y0A2_9BACT|nr:MAG: Signal peptidase I [Candidatus Adlerbacteria bacterium GW2011_GWB1_54_7]OGC79369.1 MAG: signal peptidase I [Candidatus Adlerbacteria bacterium RIFCSPHIGHO2_01_FULL_54_23]OGC87288.1 MAG: signal peptidase I [Candidatus Adlerbacteria bacterium RIFCSPLOWO2_01_FULL_54_16]
MSEERGENFFTELLKFIIIAAAIVIPVRIYVAQPFIVSGASMEPTFDNGEYLIVDELSYRFNGPERYDVVIFRYPRNPSEFFIKRIVGLPNETVHINETEVSVTRKDGANIALDERYVRNKGNGGASVVNLGEGEYFVMGDNRPASSDSRVWGTLPRENITGRALLRLFPLRDFGIFPGSVSEKP